MNELEEFNQYQDFIQTELLRQLGWSINLFTSRLYQYNKGESISGVEIKYDRKMEKTGNVYIELEERHSVEKPFVKSGIFRDDNTIFYCIGDYKKAYILVKRQLQVVCENYKKNDLKKVEIDTSRGVLIPVEFLEKRHLVVKKLEFGG